MSRSIEIVVKILAKGLPFSLLLALPLSGCGDNPDKVISGPNMKFEFLKTVQGEYMANGEPALEFGSQSELNTFSNSEHSATLTYFGDQHIQLEINRRIPTIKINFDRLKASNPESGESSRLKYKCLIKDLGVLDRVSKIPKREDGKKYTHEIEQAHAEFPNAKYALSGQLSARSIIGTEKNISPDSLFSKLEPDQLEKALLETCQKDHNPSFWSNSLQNALESFSDKVIVFSKPISDNSYSSNRDSKNTYHKLGERILTKKGAEPNLKDLFYKLFAGNYQNKRPSHKDGSFDKWTPQENNITLDVEKNKSRLVLNFSSSIQNCRGMIPFTIKEAKYLNQTEDISGFILMATSPASLVIDSSQCNNLYTLRPIVDLVEALKTEHNWAVKFSTSQDYQNEKNFNMLNVSLFSKKPSGELQKVTDVPKLKFNNEPNR